MACISVKHSRCNGGLRETPPFHRITGHFIEKKICFLQHLQLKANSDPHREDFRDYRRAAVNT